LEKIDVLVAEGSVAKHYTVEHARIYTTPDDTISVLVSAFGPEALEVAARIGDGWMTTHPDAEMAERYQELGGTGPVLGALKVCWGPDEADARKLAYELWPTSGIPGQLSQDLPTPAHFEQAASIVTEEAATEGVPYGPDPERRSGPMPRPASTRSPLPRSAPTRTGSSSSTNASCAADSAPRGLPARLGGREHQVPLVADFDFAKPFLPDRNAVSAPSAA
jgi:alkanesulfonate monooxygenase SsuD/methylene tetrahydromethanopterin reductase-like flavin-dependent oxidoreductase (luciferase family)